MKNLINSVKKKILTQKSTEVKTDTNKKSENNNQENLNNNKEIIEFDKQKRL